MLKYYLFVKEGDKGCLQVAIIAENLEEAKKYLKTRYSDGDSFRMVFHQFADGMIIVY